jgi:hypothetical protein
MRVSHPPGLAFAELLHALPRLGAVLKPAPPADSPEPAVGRSEADIALRTALDPDAVHTSLRPDGGDGGRRRYLD